MKKKRNVLPTIAFVKDETVIYSYSYTEFVYFVFTGPGVGTGSGVTGKQKKWYQN